MVLAYMLSSAKKQTVNKAKGTIGSVQTLKNVQTGEEIEIWNSADSYPSAFVCILMEEKYKTNAGLDASKFVPYGVQEIKLTDILALPAAKVVAIAAPLVAEINQPEVNQPLVAGV